MTAGRAGGARGGFTLGVERRYPLRLGSAQTELTALYRAACRDVWDPESVVDIGALRALGAASPRPAAAAAAAWDFAAWVEYTAITESDALLIRFCIEDDREAELKYLLTTRGQGRALAAETCSLVATALGPPAAPAVPRRLAGSVRGPTRRLLDADVAPEALVCSRLVMAEAVDVAVLEVALAHAVPDAVRSVLERLLSDRRRMVEFGWAYARARLPGLGREGRAAVVAVLADLVAEERAGARCAALALARARPPAAAEPTTAPEAARAPEPVGADLSGATELSGQAGLAAAAGLGVAPAGPAAEAVAGAVDATLAGLDALGIVVPGRPLS